MKIRNEIISHKLSFCILVTQLGAFHRLSENEIDILVELNGTGESK